MTEPIRSRPFVSENDNTFLWECLTTRSSGIPLSRRLAIADWALALDLDKAVTYRLWIFDREQMKDSAKLIAHEVFGDGLDGGDNHGASTAEVW